MFRNARRFAPLLRSLLFGAVTAGCATMAAGTIVGCADENDPMTHVKKLGDPATRTPAVKRLAQFFEDAMTRDNKDRNGPTVKPLVDKIVGPLTEVCTAGDLDDRTNSNIIKLLSDMRDARTEPCLVKALKDYRPGNTEDDVRYAARAVAALKLKSAAAPLIEVFGKTDASNPKSQTHYRDVHDAMVALADPSWESQLINYLGHPVDPKDQKVLMKEMFWQITAAELLGLMKSANAVKPLIKVTLSPAKANAHITSILALVKIGKPTVAPTVALLKGEDKDLIDYSKVEFIKAAGGDKKAEKGAESAHVAMASLILATIGREETGAPLVEAVGKTEDAGVRAVIARELTKLPKSDATLKAFQDAFEKTPTNAQIPGVGAGAREVMLESATMFFDASLVPWMIQQAKSMKGDEYDLPPIREATFGAALKLAKADQVALLDELYNQKTTGADGKPSVVGKAFEKEYKLTKELLTACGDKIDCYLGKVAEPASQDEKTQFTGIKAAYMIGILGDASTRQKIVDLMPKLTNAAVRYVSATAIDFLSPKGDAQIAAALRKMVDEAEEQRDQVKIKLNTPLKQVIYRLEARAQ